MADGALAEPYGPRYTDPNGNTTLNSRLANADGTTTTTASDSLGRTAYTGTTTFGSAVQYPGDNFYSGSQPIRTVYTGYDSSGAVMTYTINYIPTQVNTAFGTGPLEITDHLAQIGSIVMPNGTQYSFEYEPTFGMVNAIHLPNGAVIRYTYAVYRNTHTGYPEQGDTRVYVHTRTQTLPDGSTATWTIDIPNEQNSEGGGFKVSTVTYPTSTAGVADQSVFTSAGSSLTDAKIYAGSVSGNPLREYRLQYLADEDPTVDSCFSMYSDRAAPYPVPVAIRPQVITTVLQNGQTSRLEYSYDSVSYTYHSDHCMDQTMPAHTYTTSRGNVTQIRQYDGTGALVKVVDKSYLHEVGPNSAAYLAANIVNKVVKDVLKDGAGNLVRETDYVFDDYGPSGGSGMASVVGAPGHNDTDYPASRILRGNLTQVKQWMNAGGTPWLTTVFDYDSLGNILTKRDPRGYVTSWTYADSWATVDCAPAANAFAYPTSKTIAYGTPLAETTQALYYPCSGLTKSIKDPNDIAAGRAGTLWTYDSMGRTLTLSLPEGGGKTYCYTDESTCAAGSMPFTTYTSVLSAPDPDVTTAITEDGLGRPITSTLVNDPAGAVYTDTTYDSAGRVHSVSNPHRNSSSSTDGVTVFRYDAVGRKTQVTEADGAVQSWCFDGLASNGQTNCFANQSGVAGTSWEDFTDETGHHWQHASDALGDLRAVTEPDPMTGALSLSTLYSYDVFGDLTGVNQAGKSGEISRSRSFAYDSISHLLWSKNPETGTICYGHGDGTVAGCQADGYDADGNLLYKTDARGVVTGYNYDALNRLTFEHYSDGTLPAAFGYDGFAEDGTTQIPGSTNSIGRLSHISNQVNAAANYGYDAKGRMSMGAFCLPSDCSYATAVSGMYDLAGNIIDLTYPDHHHIHQIWDGAGHLASSNLVDIGGVAASQSYLQSVVYSPDGAPNTVTLGNGVQQRIEKNRRLQVQSMSVSTPLPPFAGRIFLSHNYCYSNCLSGGGTANNGNIWEITDALNSAKTQAFTYDALNRISSFSLGGALNQQYGIDSFGDMSPVTGGTAVFAFDPATNRISNLPCGASVPSYDAAGNQLCDLDANGGVIKYTFDAESRISQITVLNSATPYERYTYGADNGRVRKENADGSFTEYIAFGGKPIAEKNQSGAWTDYIYGNGQKIAKSIQQKALWHMHAVRDSSSNMAAGAEGGVNGVLSGVANLTVMSGDQLVMDIKQEGVASGGGIALIFTNGTRSGDLADTVSGTRFYYNTVADGAWHHMAGDLAFYEGLTVSSVLAGLHNSMPAGTNDTWMANIAVVRANGSIVPIFNGQNISVDGFSGTQPGGYNLLADTETVATDPATASSFFFADHLGTTQMEFTNGGWPISQSQMKPYGNEINPQATADHYRFTGKERDPESGLDYFGARYYGSNMGRFMSPDWSEEPEAIPYASLSNPQSMNLYSYVKNNPLRQADPDGHCCVEEEEATETGAEIGAEIGTFIEPGGGTAVGGVIGGVIGLGLGAYADYTITHYMMSQHGKNRVIPTNYENLTDEQLQEAYDKEKNPVVKEQLKKALKDRELKKSRQQNNKKTAAPKLKMDPASVRARQQANPVPVPAPTPPAPDPPKPPKDDHGDHP